MFTITIITVEYVTPVKRTKWNGASCEAVMKAFGDHIRCGTHPKTRDICSLIESTPCLREKHRTVAHLRSWIQAKSNQIRGHRFNGGIIEISFKRPCMSKETWCQVTRILL